ENDQAVRVSDLLQPPATRLGNWNLARPARTQRVQFQGIVLATPPTLDNLFGEESAEIGSEKGEELPPAPGETKDDKLSKAGRGAREAFARNINNLLRQLPHHGQHTWLNDVQNWANRQLRGVSEQLERLRNKELHRLLHLLDSDPEAGLRHAIPLN